MKRHKRLLNPSFILAVSFPHFNSCAVYMVLQLIRVSEVVAQTIYRHEFAIIDVLKFGLTDLIVAV